jgi:hypothetical protein
MSASLWWLSGAPEHPGARVPLVFRWDLDKTYLKTQFEHVRDLMRIPFEGASDKVAAPGVIELIRAIRRFNEAADREVRVFFLTATPPQLGRAIRDKLSLDGIEYDGITFKDQLQHLVRGRFRNLREHVGFKLSELLKSRGQMPPESHEVLFGDDWESDPLVYSLYADILAGRVDRALVHDVLEAIRVDPALIADVKRLMSAHEPREVVRRIYINLERRTPPARFHAFGRRLVPTFNYLQTAASLYAGGLLDLDGVAGVARSLVEASAYSPERLGNSLADIERRGHLLPSVAGTLRESLKGQRLIAGGTRPQQRSKSLFQRLLRWIQPAPSASAGEPLPAIDYRALVAEWRPARGPAGAAPEAAAGNGGKGA